MNWFSLILQAITAALSSLVSSRKPDAMATPEPPAPAPPDPAAGFAAIRAAEDARLARARESTAPVVVARQPTESAVDRAEDAGAMLEAPMVAADVLGDDEQPTVRRPQ